MQQACKVWIDAAFLSPRDRSAGQARAGWDPRGSASWDEGDAMIVDRAWALKNLGFDPIATPPPRGHPDWRCPHVRTVAPRARAQGPSRHKRAPSHARCARAGPFHLFHGALAPALLRGALGLARRPTNAGQNSAQHRPASGGLGHQQSFEAPARMTAEDWLQTVDSDRRMSAGVQSCLSAWHRPVRRLHRDASR